MTIDTSLVQHFAEYTSSKLSEVAMYLTSQGSAQVYSPFGSYIVEQHDGHQSSFAVPDLPAGHKGCGALSFDQAAIGLGLQRYYPAHSIELTPSRLQVLMNIVLYRGTRTSR